MWRSAVAQPVAREWRQRAQPLLGTVVIVRIATRAGVAPANCEVAFDAAFAAIRRISVVMSAHHPDSDLGRLARAAPDEVLRLDPQTLAVLRLARAWQARSRGAYDPVRAACRLHRLGRRPGFADVKADEAASLRDIHVRAPDEVLLRRPVLIDLGGLAKGYAVDQAVAVLRAHGVTDALVNAGGDMRTIGELAWPLQFRDAWRRNGALGQRPPSHLCNAALATSRTDDDSEFVPAAGRRRPARTWSACSVLAKDCVSADALTKWGLQARTGSLALRQALRAQRAQLWRWA